jgi:hypothetical protein
LSEPLQAFYGILGERLGFYIKGDVQVSDSYLFNQSFFITGVIMRLLLATSYLVKLALAASRTTAPSGCITVGSGGTYSTVRLYP